MCAKRIIDPRKPYASLPPGMQFTEEMLKEIEMWAQTTPEEMILSRYGIDSIQELGEDDQKYFTYAIKKAKAYGIYQAGTKLQVHMSDRQKGVQACLEYLTRFGDWEVNEPDTAVNEVAELLSNVAKGVPV